MAPPDWRSLFVRDGQVRALWRILLFVALFLALLSIGALLLNLLAPPLRGLGPGALFAQGLLSLAAALGAGWILLVWLDGRPPGALGFAWTSRTLAEIGVGLGIGAASLAGVVAVLALVGWISYRPEEGTAAALFLAVVIDLVVLLPAAAAEEAIFRGYPFQVLVQASGPVAATGIASALFALAHGSNPNVDALALVNIFLAGVLLSAAYLRTRSLWFATAVHLGWNWCMASVLDLPVSGLQAFDTPLYEPVVTGPRWITGGEFGPEGGIAGTVAFLVALIAVLLLPGLEEAREMKALRPLVDRYDATEERG